MTLYVSKRSSRFAKVWDSLQIVLLITISGVLIFNPISSIKNLLTLIGAFMVLGAVIHLLTGLHKKAMFNLLMASLEGILGLFLIFNTVISLSILSFFIGMLFILGAFVAFFINKAITSLKKREKVIIDQDSMALPPPKSKKLKAFLQKTSPLILGGVGGGFILFPTFAGVAISYLLAGIFILIAGYKIGKLFQP